MLFAGLAAYLAKTYPGIVSMGFLVITVLGFVVLAGYSLLNSRCPRCSRYMNLAGPGAYCPHCGVWIPYQEGETKPVVIERGDKIAEERGNFDNEVSSDS